MVSSRSRVRIPIVALSEYVLRHWKALYVVMVKGYHLTLPTSGSGFEPRLPHLPAQVPRMEGGIKNPVTRPGGEIGKRTRLRPGRLRS